MKEANWFEKTFTLDLPVEVFPAIVERVRGTPARLEEIVNSYPSEILTMKPDGAWSIQEHVGHLLDLEELHEGRLDDYAAHLEVLRAADLSNKKTEEARHNEGSIESLLAAFRATRKRFVDRLESLDDQSASASAQHPRLQKQMSVVGLAHFVAEHDDHHLAAITRVSRSLAQN